VYSLNIAKLNLILIYKHKHHTFDASFKIFKKQWIFKAHFTIECPIQRQFDNLLVETTSNLEKKQKSHNFKFPT